MSARLLHLLGHDTRVSSTERAKEAENGRTILLMAIGVTGFSVLRNNQQRIRRRWFWQSFVIGDVETIRRKLAFRRDREITGAHIFGCTSVRSWIRCCCSILPKRKHPFCVSIVITKNRFETRSFTKSNLKKGPLSTHFISWYLTQREQKFGSLLHDYATAENTKETRAVEWQPETRGASKPPKFLKLKTKSER